MAPSDPLDPEALLVSGGLIRPALVAEAARRVDPSDFCNDGLKTVWGALVKMVDEGLQSDRIDVMSVAARCAKGVATQRKIAKFCAGLLDGVPRFSSLVGSADAVHRKATLRIALSRVRALAKELQQEVEAPIGDVANLEERLTQLSVDIVARGDGRLSRTLFADSAKEVEAYFDELVVGPPPDAIPSGIKGLDRRLGGGFRPGKLYTLVAPTGFGKTAFASQVADHAVEKGKRALLFSMEVDPVDVFIRDVERTAGRSRWDLRSRSSTMRERAQAAIVAAQSALLSKSAGKVVYGEPMSVTGMRQAILTEQLRGGTVALVVVDHAQVAKPSKEEKQGMPRYLEVKGIAAGLRQVARRLNVAVLMTAQMNPPAKKEKPSMALVRESKDISNSSDAVLVGWHNKEETPDGDVYITASYLLVEKVRAGSPGKVKIRYQGDLFKFEDEGLEEPDQE